MEERERSMEEAADKKRTAVSDDLELVGDTAQQNLEDAVAKDGTQEAGSANPGSWSWGSFLQKATTDIVGKSSAMVEFMKRDLTEFTETMQKDTAIIVNDATQSLKGKTVMEEAGKAAGMVKSGISSFFGSINASLAMFDEQTRSEEAAQQHSTRSQARLAAVQHDPNTFQKEPSGRPEDFEAWLLMFDINKMRSEMERLLDTVESIQEFYDKFVPLVVTHNEFWQRYFYRVYQLQKDEKRIQSLMARSSDTDRTPDDLDWGDDEADTGATSPSAFLDPSEVCSVVSNESFQMVNHESVTDRDVGDAVLAGSDNKTSSFPSSSGHKKQESSGSSSDWEQLLESPVKNPNRDAASRPVPD